MGSVPSRDRPKAGARKFKASSRSSIAAKPVTGGDGPDNGGGQLALEPAALAEDDWDLHFVSLSEAVELIEVYSTYIFARADIGGHGALSVEDFLALAQSATLDLGLDDKAAKRMFKTAANADGVITLKEFVPLMRQLMALHSKKRKLARKSDWQWFCMFLDDSASTLPVYYNTTSDQMTYDRPSCIERVEESEQQDFQQMIRISDGAIFTSFVGDDGVRMFLDWDVGEWRVFPAEWKEDFVLEDTQAQIYADEPWSKENSAGGSRERFRHPITGVEYETSMEDGQRLIFDDSSKEWVPMPVLLEVFVPTVARALEEIHQQVPDWSNAYEQVLALRLHRYNCEEVILWRLKDQHFVGLQPGLVEPTTGSEWAFNAAALLKIYNEQAAMHKQVIENTAEYQAMQKSANEYQAQLATTKATVQRLQDRVVELEAQAQAPALPFEEADAVMMVQQQARIAELTADLEALKKGANVQATMQASLAAKDKALAELHAELAAVGRKTQTSGKAQKAVISRLRFEVQALRDDGLSLRRMVHAELAPTMVQLMQHAQQSLTRAADQSVELATRDLVAKYRYEVRQRKLLYNKLQELKGNIRVFCRVRSDTRVTCALQFPDATDLNLGTPNELVCPNPRDARDKKKFEFDAVFNPGHTQEDVCICCYFMSRTMHDKLPSREGKEEGPGTSKTNSPLGKMRRRKAVTVWEEGGGHEDRDQLARKRERKMCCMRQGPGPEKCVERECLVSDLYSVHSSLGCFRKLSCSFFPSCIAHIIFYEMPCFHLQFSVTLFPFPFL